MELKLVLKLISDLFIFIQISDTLTAFIGGTSDPNGIVTFDWTTLTQRKIPAKFREARLEAGCARIRSSSGENLVAVVGG